jgi:superfamily II DNA or RNA helicase
MPFASSTPVRLLFDRGTILIRDPDPGLERLQMRSVLWDWRVRAYRAPAQRYHTLRRELAERGLPFSDEVRLPAPPPSVWSAVELRPYQEAALWAWELAQCRALVVLPTGSWKTRMAIAAMAQWQQQIAGAYAGPIGCYGDGAHELAAVTVATFESAYRHMDRLGNRFDLLVVDEAHHFGCGPRDEALEMSIADARLGLTATPPQDEAVARRLAAPVGRTAYELTIGDLAGAFSRPSTACPSISS